MCWLPKAAMLERTACLWGVDMSVLVVSQLGLS
jgi:hypothetical protein